MENLAQMPRDNDVYDDEDVESVQLFYLEILSDQAELKFFLYDKVWVIDKLAKGHSNANFHWQRRALRNI